ncbi:MAG TPA: AraC family transcriptional regulator, partial [Candidatus Paenibacillus intestinavium]|nr:AraC family transcriptional regulator [Candidatus Paenibacillus intestinavium]
NQVEVAFEHEAFVNALKWLTFSQAKEQLDQYFNDVKKTQALDEYSLKRFIQHIIYTVMSNLEHLKLPFTEQSSEKLIWFKKIDLATTIDELEQTMTLFMGMVQDQFNEHNEHNEVNLLNQIIDYIHANYDQDISLSELAEKFHMNYSYLSWYFKHRTNENMTAYINKLRIEKAKELLKYNEDTISQISMKIGFSEHNYFSKVFKKFTGMTPVEYRNTHSK